MLIITADELAGFDFRESAEPSMTKKTPSWRFNAAVGCTSILPTTQKIARHTGPMLRCPSRCQNILCGSYGVSMFPTLRLDAVTSHAFSAPGLTFRNPIMV